MDTGVSYQGQLKQDGIPVTGEAAMIFELWDAMTSGNSLASMPPTPVRVTSGLFLVELDFGAGVFDGNDRWLEIQVEFPSGAGNWATLTPRQRLTATPYALQTRGLYVDDAGQVGIGTTNPSSALHVWGDANRVMRVRNSSASGGVAIVAEATGGSGFTAALDAYTSSPDGSTIYAFNEAESGNGYAMQAEAASPNGVAIYGRASNRSERSTGVGVRGRSDSDYGGTGVYGEATNTGTTYGVRGVSAHGTGVRGENTDTSNYGVLGSDTAGAYGRGYGTNPGVRGVSAGTGPAGRFVINDAANAAPAVEAHTPNDAGYAGYFTGGQNYFEGKVGIGTDMPCAPLHLTNAGNWHWTLGDGWGDFTINDGDHGFSIGVHPDYAITYMWTTGDAERLRIGNPTDGVLLSVEDDGVGIGTISPAEKLDIMGNAKVRGNVDVDGLIDADNLKLHGTTGDGWVMTSDAGGNASWQPPPSGDGVWADAGTHISYTAGNVGIGTATPEHALDIDGKVVMEEIDGVGSGWIRTIGANGEPNAQITYLDTYPNHGFISAKNAGGYTLAGIYVDQDGQGVVHADVKSFRVPHPDKPLEDIWYACVEGPEAAMYVRGTGQLVHGRATIELPEHFRALAVEDSMTVQLTPRSFESKGLAVGRQALDGIEVGELNGGRGNYEFHWEVKAVRRAHQDFAVTRPWTHATPGSSISEAKRWSTRLESIEQRKERIQQVEARLANAPNPTSH